jgi:transketolase N-terminal domain/subunit
MVKVEASDLFQDSSWRAAATLLLLSAKYGNGHVSSSISCVDILLASFKSRDLNTRKEVILSKGHAATAWYATLFQGFFSNPHREKGGWRSEKAFILFD